MSRSSVQIIDLDAYRAARRARAAPVAPPPPPQVWPVSGPWVLVPVMVAPVYIPVTGGAKTRR